MDIFKPCLIALKLVDSSARGDTGGSLGSAGAVNIQLSPGAMGLSLTLEERTER